MEQPSDGPAHSGNGPDSPDERRSVDQAIARRRHHQERHWLAFHRAMALGRTEGDGQRLRLPAVHGNGTTVEIEGDFGIVLAEDGRAIGVVGFLRRPPSPGA